jgi:CheY-like chemotaxis protein
MQPVRVLAVDDNLEVLEVIVSFLTEGGFDVVSATSGENAITILQADGAVALLVTDIAMPGLNGVALANRGLAIRPGLKVLFITGATHELAERSPTLPGPYLLKPLRMTELLKAARDLLGLPPPS